MTRDWLRLAAICGLKTARCGAFLRQNDSNPGKSSQIGSPPGPKRREPASFTFATDQTLLEIFLSAIWCYLVLLAAIGVGFRKRNCRSALQNASRPSPPAQTPPGCGAGRASSAFPRACLRPILGGQVRPVGGVPHRKPPKITHLCTPSCPPCRGPSTAPPATVP